jgi:peptidoglycan/xylan/chitin deacetylase (PgdA/CDA1 family)
MIGWLSPHSYLGRFQRDLCETGMAILTYHRIGNPPAGVPDPFLYDSPRALSQHIERAQSCGLKFVPFSSGITSSTFTPKTITITFDDGFTSVLQHALPILQHHKASAIQFIVAGLVGKKNIWDSHKGDSMEPLMDWSQIREWIAAGHEIGSHSVTHPNLKKLKPAEVREEITSSKKMLEDNLGIPVDHFCYPHGGWNPVVRDIVIDAGYKSSCAVRLGVAQSRSDQWALPRIAPLTPFRLIKKIQHRALRKVRGHDNPPTASQSEY